MHGPNQNHFEAMAARLAELAVSVNASLELLRASYAELQKIHAAVAKKDKEP